MGHDEPDFKIRNNLDSASLLDLFTWTEQEFLERTEGSAIRRTGYINWLRNIAIALGNAEASPEHLSALREKMQHDNAVVREHALWAYEQLTDRINQPASVAKVPE